MINCFKKQVVCFVLILIVILMSANIMTFAASGQVNSARKIGDYVMSLISSKKAQVIYNPVINSRKYRAVSINGKYIKCPVKNQNKFQLAGITANSPYKDSCYFLDDKNCLVTDKTVLQQLEVIHRINSISFRYFHQEAAKTSTEEYFNTRYIQLMDEWSKTLSKAVVVKGICDGLQDFETMLIENGIVLVCPQAAAIYPDIPANNVSHALGTFSDTSINIVVHSIAMSYYKNAESSPNNLIRIHNKYKKEGYILDFKDAVEYMTDYTLINQALAALNFDTRVNASEKYTFPDWLKGILKNLTEDAIGGLAEQKATAEQLAKFADNLITASDISTAFFDAFGDINAMTDLLYKLDFYNNYLFTQVTADLSQSFTYKLLIESGALDALKQAVKITSVPNTKVNKGASASITLNIKPTDAKITAKSSSINTAKVSVKGKVITITGVAPGMAVITVTAARSGYTNGTATFTVTVEKPPVKTAGIAMIAAEYYHTIALKEDGTVWTWGDNYYGNLGDGTTEGRSLPVQIKNLSNVKMVASGDCHAAALKSDGTVWAWGLNLDGELGDGTTQERHTPVQVSGLSDVKMISAGGRHTVALKEDGTVWAWGANYNGSIGDGTSENRLTPVQVTGLDKIRMIAAGKDFSVALKDDGTVYTWGWSSYDHVYDSTTLQYTPVKVEGLSGVKMIDTANYCTAALKEDGTIWMWGGNEYGQLGDGTTSDRGAPVQVKGLDSVKAVAVGDGQTVALKEDGSVWAWGSNADGQIGDGTTVNRNTPVHVKNLSDVVMVAAGVQHTAALKSDGTVWEWGGNYWGCLGDGTNERRLTPVQVKGLKLLK